MGAPESPRELSSWKEIANFLGVAVRTVQKWEQERGLPVKRLPGKRGVVYADPAELLAWKKATPTATASRGRLALAGVVALVLVAAATTALHPWSRKSAPAGYRIEGKILTVFDERGRELWRKVFPLHADAAHYPHTPIPGFRIILGLENATGWSCTVCPMPGRRSGASCQAERSPREPRTLTALF